MEKDIISMEIVSKEGDYTIVKSEERELDACGKPFGKIMVWYDICLGGGCGDIVASCQTLKEAKKWVKEH